MKLDRRGFLAGVGLVMTAPAIVRASTLMVAPRRPWPPLLFGVQGRLICNGALVRIQDYPELFSAMGTVYGGGADHFRLPDLSPSPVAEVALGFRPSRYSVNAFSWQGGPAGMLSLEFSQ